MSNATTMAALNKLVRGLNAAPAAVERGLAKATLEIRELVTDEFKSKTNPWGRAWAPSKQPNPLLVSTGTLVDSIRIEQHGSEIRTTVGVKYSRYIQRGRRNFKRKHRATVSRLRGEGYSEHLIRKQKGLMGTVMRPRTVIPFKALPPTWGVALATSLMGEIEKAGKP